LFIGRFWVAFCFHIQDEMGRNSVNCFRETMKGGRDVFICDIEPFLLHRQSFPRLDSRMSVMPVPYRIRLHCLAVSLSDTADDIGRCPWAAIGLAFGDVSKKVAVHCFDVMFLA
jgi:hypothetical protein